MKLLSGHVAPTVGEISMAGHPVQFRNAVEAEAAGVVLVHQEILLAADLTVAENLFLGRELGPGPMVDDRAMNRRRSEEHTSELQSLMRISYAVFCLKKKKKKRTNE